MPDGTPHVTPVWVGYDADDDHVPVNTERGRQKDANVARNPRVSLSMMDPENPCRWLSILGEVDEVTTEGARDYIDQLARRYTGADEYQNPIQTERIIMRIHVDSVLP